MSQMSFSCTALQGVNKVGVLKPDTDGYYTVVLGALDFQNSYGAVYPEAPAKELFKQSSSFMRRVKNAQCRGEYGHPKREPGMSDQDFIRRVLTIEETRVCVHIADCWIDYTSVKGPGGTPCIAIIGKVRPTGPHGPTLEAQFANPKENVAFSIRSLTDDRWIGGRLHKFLTEIVCWDYVNEPGLSVATKYNSPALEAISQDHVVTEASLLAVKRNITLAGNVGFESGLQIIDAAIAHLSSRRNTARSTRTPSSGW
jgi:hypothetical protein